jgi:hypothetical protein
VATGTVNIAALPSISTTLQASFAGDGLLQSSQSAITRLTLATSPVTVDIISAQIPQSNPVTFTVRITPQGCSAVPTGNLEVLDGGAPVVVLPVAGVAEFDTHAIIVNVTMSRPPGSHSIQVRYSGDRVYQPAASAAASIVFQ